VDPNCSQIILISLLLLLDKLTTPQKNTTRLSKPRISHHLTSGNCTSFIFDSLSAISLRRISVFLRYSSDRSLSSQYRQVNLLTLLSNNKNPLPHTSKSPSGFVREAFCTIAAGLETEVGRKQALSCTQNSKYCTLYHRYDRISWT